MDKDLQSHFLNLYAIALSDTQVDTTELALLYEFGRSRGIAEAAIESILVRPDETRFEIPDDLLKKIEYLYEFAQMIWADGKVDDYERVALEKFCRKFGFAEEVLVELTTFLLDSAGKKTPLSEVLDTVRSTA